MDVRNVAISFDYLALKKQLDTIPAGKNILMNFENAKLVDHTVMENLNAYQEHYARAGGTKTLNEMWQLIPCSQDPLAIRSTNKTVLA